MYSAFNGTSCFYTMKTFKVPAGFPKALHISSSSVTLPGKGHGDKSLVPAGDRWSGVSPLLLAY